MKVAITGGTGFVGRHLARRLVLEGHEVVLIARGQDHRDEYIRNVAGVSFQAIGTNDVEKLFAAFQGCDTVAHCAGINREIGPQTYKQVHVQGTKNVVDAAGRAGIKKIALLSFLRARPNCGSLYHESKWMAEEIVRNSGLDYTIFKAGVIYGAGDHMLDHLSHAFYTFPLFALVGMKDQHIRPLAVEDLAAILETALLKNRLSRQTVAIIGPEDLTLSEAVKRVASAVGKNPFWFRAPLWFHYVLGTILERIMKVPLVSIAQVRILSEGIVEPLPFADQLPKDLLPTHPFSQEQIKAGLPNPGGFGLKDLLWT
jgi:NADH dehydrogenase